MIILMMCRLHEQCYRLVTMPVNTGGVVTGRRDDCNLFQRAPHFEQERKIKTRHFLRGGRTEKFLGQTT